MQPVLTFSDEHQAWIVVPSHSLIGVFVKSLHLLAASWVLTVMSLWLALDPAQRGGANMLLHAAIPAFGIEAAAWSVERWTKARVRIAYARARARSLEWKRAVSWTTVPIAFLAVGAFLVTG